MKNNESKPEYTVTAALPYANGPIHLGHVSGVYLPADIFVRYLRMQQRDVLFLCGTDEHGAAITLRAKKEGISPKQIVDKYHNVIKNSFNELGISFDVFHRTSEQLHHHTAQEFFKKLWEEEKFVEKKSKQYFDQKNQQFLADRYITGTCPKCQYNEAYGDQCESCGADLSPMDLISPKSTLSGEVPIIKETKHWYLPMNRHEDWLKKWVKDGVLDGESVHDPKEWRNQVVGQCLSWIDGGLKPRAMTRDLDWGVKVPIKGNEGKVLYVWLDAPIGYISATKQWAIENNKDWKKYWCKEEAGDRKLVHFIGKDNIVFHAIIFPILLKDHGGFILPYNVPSSEFLNLEGRKFSTSKNWAVWLHEYMERYPEKGDELRYVLTSIAPESKDAEFTWKEYQARINNELVAIFGNFVNRTIVLVNKYYDGAAPYRSVLTEKDLDLLKLLEESKLKIASNIESYKIREAQSEVMNIARLGNKYLAEQEPWKQIKVDPKRVETIMSLSLHVCAVLSIAFHPFLPKKADKLQKILGINEGFWFTQDIETLIPGGQAIKKPEMLFQKIEDEFIDKEIERLHVSEK